MERPALLSIRRLAEEYAISEDFLYRLAWSGRLAGAFRVGRNWYVKRPAFEAWLEDGGPGGAPARPQRGRHWR